MDRKGSGEGDSRHYYRTVAELASIPLMLGAAVMVGWWLGRWADRRLHSDWVFQAIGVAIGMAAAVRETVRLVRRVSKELDER
jgi:F0F1-type ATP synthase assembly protein I